MGIAPVYWLADFQSGNLLEPLPLGAVSDVSLSSSLRPGSFSATVDLQAAGFSQTEARGWVDLIRFGRCTLVPILEGLTQGDTVTSRELGEWWIAAAEGTYRSPRITISGPEWDGYLTHLSQPDTIVGMTDPVQKSRELMERAYTTSQSVAVDLQSWVSHSGARVRLDVKGHTRDYASVIDELATSEEGPFEWMTRTGLVLDGWVPRKVTRTLEVGQPHLALARPGVTLEVAAPGLPPASLLDAGWAWDKRAWPSTVYGWGGGSGDDQVGPVYRSRDRAPGEPAINAMITRRDASTRAVMGRHVQGALERLTPHNTVFSAALPVTEYTPRKGEVYGFYADAGWAQASVERSAQCAGWSWSSGSPESWSLELVEV